MLFLLVEQHLQGFIPVIFRSLDTFSSFPKDLPCQQTGYHLTDGIIGPGSALELDLATSGQVPIHTCIQQKVKT